MIHIQPKGNRVLVEEIPKDNVDNKTDSGLIVLAPDKGSGDNALLRGKVITVGTPEVNDKGHIEKPDVETETVVWFNRYNAFKVITKGITPYWLVHCRDIWGVGEI
jgi:co-chaperonin GroES (HSP10)